MPTPELLCSDECLTTCEVLSRLGKAGLTLAHANGIVDSARQAVGLRHSTCMNQGPVDVKGGHPWQPGPDALWQRCDLPMDVQNAVSGVAAAIEAGYVLPTQ